MFRNFNELEEVLDAMRYAQITEDTTGTNILSNDVPENRVFYPVVLVLSDTAGAANTISVAKVEEDDSTNDVLPNFNLDSSESRVIQIDDVGVPVPRLEGGTNLQFTAGSDGVEVTMYYSPNEV